MTRHPSTTVTPSTRMEYVGDGYDGPVLLKYRRVAEVLDIPNPKDVYDLPIRRVRVSEGRVRWRSDDVQDFIERRTEDRV